MLRRMDSREPDSPTVSGGDLGRTQQDVPETSYVEVEVPLRSATQLLCCRHSAITVHLKYNTLCSGTSSLLGVVHPPEARADRSEGEEEAAGCADTLDMAQRRLRALSASVRFIAFKPKNRLHSKCAVEGLPAARPGANRK